MGSSPRLEDWLDKLSGRMVAIGDHRQRLAIFTEAITGLAPQDAACAFRRIVGRGVRLRDSASKLIVETAMLGLAQDTWPRAHRILTRDAAERMDDPLTAVFVGMDAPRSRPEDDDPFPLPDYTGGRPLALGERRAIAAKPDRRLLSLALRDPHPMVIAKLLDNPRLTENDVVFLAARRPAPSDALGEVGRHPRWRRSKRVATALVLNPYTPPRIGMTLLHMLTLDEIKDTTRDDRLQLLLRKAAREVLSECKRD